MTFTAAGEEHGSDESLRNAALDLIAGSRLCALVTVAEGGSPDVRMMDAFEPEGDLVVWLGTNTLSRKVAQIRANPHVAVYFADPDAPGYVTIKGEAKIVDDPEEKAKRWKDGWSSFYREDRSNYILIQVRPETVEIVNYRLGVVSEAETWAAPVLRPGEDTSAKKP